ncbi:MAG: nucleotide exchange factor GrpE [Planctomycetota bacterium]|nr:MAG: nucleotide exchange factor GrpE [Planctomycetota bacterium]REJ92629.1 MAG: nucleotide exchange factor GrpE [Planctomycetota bacterium]REK26742.1 MAG: nucleotide exchange factor GrpE [Planctomycetota bacterium]REK34740.1 MAG: nucleotide exchange factor GrpE [Planctomycetota bacterium]
MSEEQDKSTPADEAPENIAENAHEETAENDAEASSLEEQLAGAIDERDASHDQFLRAQAELDNYRKRVSRERDEERRFAALPVVRDLLPVIDNLKRAADAARGSGQAPDLVEGIDLVLQQLDGVLTGHGVTRIPGEGEAFDPHLHEAVSQAPSAEHPPMTIVQELEQGYLLHDRVVRPSKVIVSAPASAETGKDTG